MCKLDNCVLTLFEIKAGVCSDSGDLERVFAHALARCLDRAMQSVSRLKHQDGSRIASEFFGDRTRRCTSNFFIGHQHQRHRAGELPIVPFEHCLDHM